MPNLGPHRPKDTYQRLVQVPAWTDGSTPAALQLGDGTTVPVLVGSDGLYLPNGAQLFIWDAGTSSYVPASLSSLQTVVGEVPSGAINGANATFTTAHSFVPGTVEVLVNGVAQLLGTDFVTTGTTVITLSYSPAVGENITINYTRA